MNNIKNHFFKGLLYIVPVAVLIWVIVKAYSVLNSIIGDFLPGNLKYLGIIILLIIITAFGYLGSVFIASPINDFFRKILEKAPLLKTIYSSSFLSDGTAISNSIVSIRISSTSLS